MKCGHCSRPATWRIVWAGGRAFWHTCDQDKSLGLRTIRKNGRWAEIVSVKRIKLASRS